MRGDSDAHSERQDSWHAASCAGKARMDRKAAMRVALETNARNRRKRQLCRGKVEAFHCSYCGGWHIGSWYGA